MFLYHDRIAGLPDGGPFLRDNVTVLHVLRCYGYALRLNFTAQRAGCSVAWPLENDHVGPVLQTVGRRLPQKAVGKGFPPLLRVKVRGDQGARRFVSSRYEIMEILLLVDSERLQQEVVKDEKRNLAQHLEPPLEGSGGPGRLQASHELGTRRHQNVGSLTNHFVSQGLGDMALAHPTGSDQQHVGRLSDEVARLKLRNDLPVEMGMAGEVEEIQGFSASEPRPLQALGQKVLLPPRHFVRDQGREEVFVGHLSLDRLPVAFFQGLQKTVEMQFLEHGGQFGGRIHAEISFVDGVSVLGEVSGRANRVVPFR